jgi:hypothetical protein
MTRRGQLALPGWIDPVVEPIDHVDAASFAEVDLFPAFEQISHGDLFGIRLSNSTVDLTHGLHRFPAKFIPQIPRWALRQFASSGGTVLDPFMGSGTSLVEALLRPGPSVGADIDPLSRLIAKAKTEVPDVDRVRALGTELRRRWRSPARRLEVPMNGLVQFEHWFTSDAWGDLQSLLRHINELDCRDTERRFLLVVFSSIVRWVSNADDQSQKTYVSGTRPKTPPPVRETFWRALDKAITGLRALALAKHPRSSVRIQDDADAVNSRVPDASISLIVTSPPYLESVDYMYNAMLEYFWLGTLIGVPDRAALNDLRRRQIGTRRPFGKPELPQTLARLVSADSLPGWRRAGALSYFANMMAHFTEAARSLADGARYVLVVGNSQTQVSTVPVHDCLTRLAAATGLELEKAFAYRVRRHYMKFPRMGRGGIILLDWVIVLRKTRHPVSIPEPLPMPAFSLPVDSVST